MDSLKRPAICPLKCLMNRIERDNRGIKQRKRVMQTFQVFRNAQLMIADIELAHQFRKEKRRRLVKKQEVGVSENGWKQLLTAQVPNPVLEVSLSASGYLHQFL